MRGIYNSRPPIPQYCSTWDVLKNQGDNQDLSLKELSGKLVILMAIVSANRTAELQALDLQFRSYSPDGVTFKLLTSLTKKRKVGAPLKECFFASFAHDSCLCVVQCLCVYEKATKNFRDIKPGMAAPLFPSYVKPHKPVTSQTIAHWIKDTLEKAEVDTNTFKAHSVQGASTSAAIGKGLHIADILKTANWSRESTYQSSSSAEKNFAQAVLSCQAHLQLTRSQGRLIENSNSLITLYIYTLCISLSTNYYYVSIMK